MMLVLSFFSASVGDINSFSCSNSAVEQREVCPSVLRVNILFLSQPKGTVSSFVGGEVTLSKLLPKCIYIVGETVMLKSLQ